MQRHTLKSLVKLMFLMLGLAFAFVLFRSLTGPSLSSAVFTPFDDVQLGETALRRYQQDRVWVTRLTPALRRQLQQLSDAVVRPADGCSLAQSLCVLNAASVMDGIEVRYTESPPKRFSSKILWFGGFVDPGTGVVFDRLGRPYKNQQRTTALAQVVVPEAVLINQTR